MIHLSDGQWVGCVLLLAAIALALYGAWEWRHSVLVDEDERPIPPSDTPIADEAWDAVRDGRGMG